MQTTTFPASQTMRRGRPRPLNPDETAEPSVTGAEAVIRCLLAEGVGTLFGYIGGTIMPVYDALHDHREELRHILSRHEQGAIHAAQGYARVSGAVGVCLATSGPGATNLVTGLADALLDSTPLVVITGQVASDFLGTDAFQEIDMMSISLPITKWNTQVTTPAEIPGALARAFYIARSGRPGPVLVDITKDAQQGSLEFAYERCQGLRSYRPRPALDEQALDRAAHWIDRAERPLVLAGQGVLLAGASVALRTLAERADLPVASTLLGLSALPSDHRLNVGMLGMHGNVAPNLATNESDLLVAVGMRFDDRVTGNLDGYATGAKVIHIDIDAAELGKNVPADLPLLADAKEALESLAGRVGSRRRPDWLARFAERYRLEYDVVIGPQLQPSGAELRMPEVVRQLSEQTAGDAVVVTDVGQHQMMTGRYFDFQRPRSFVTSGGLGTMGFGLPAAMGAALATDRPVLAIVGDGGFQMTLQELATVRQQNLPVKLVILDNNFLGMVRQWQELFYDGKYSFTELANPDFVTIAAGYGIAGERVSSRAELGPAVARALACDGPYLLAVAVAKEANVFPMIEPGATVSQLRLE